MHLKAISEHKIKPYLAEILKLEVIFLRSF